MENGTRLSLVVLRAEDVERARRFYEALGATFAAERHGAGPEHYAAPWGDAVLEIYPAATERPPEAVRLGFRVPSIDAALETLRILNAEIVTPARESPWGRRAVVRDPDGRMVELTE